MQPNGGNDNMKSKQQHGGRRIGSGRKPAEFSDRIRKQMLKALRKVDKEEGCTWLDRLAECTKRSAPPQLKMTSFNAILAMMVTRRSQHITETVDRKVVELPPVKEKPESFTTVMPEAAKELTH